jgi:uncharacterized membrane protein YeaQ/YmgE (transglycosylase-associated protein family)
MGIISWLVVGALAGWIASMIMGSNAHMGLVANIIVGVIGAVIGGFVLGLFGVGGDVTGINLSSILVAVLGSCILLFVINKIR